MGCRRFISECRDALPLVEIWSHEFVNKLVDWLAVRPKCAPV